MAKVALVGAGLIGRAWAISFARAGHEVSLFDSDASAIERALAFVDSALRELQRFDLLEGRTLEAVADGSGSPRSWRRPSPAQRMSRKTPRNALR